MLALIAIMPEGCSTCMLTSHVSTTRLKRTWGCAMQRHEAVAAPTDGYCDEMSQASMVPPLGRAKAMPREV